MSVTSEELNYLIWRYLQETGNELTALALQEETRVEEFDDQYKQHIPIGTLVNLVQKGILYSESELFVDKLDDSKLLLNKNSGAVDQMLDDYMESKKKKKGQEKDGMVFNLVNALKLDISEIPKIQATGRFALADDDIERMGNQDPTNKESSNEVSNKVSTFESNTNIDKKLFSQEASQVIHNSEINRSGNDSNLPVFQPHWKEIYPINEMINYIKWNPIHSHIVTFGIKQQAVCKIVRFKQTSDSDDPQLEIDEIHELRHPFAISYTMGKVTNEITSLEWSHDGKFILTGVENGEIRLWTIGGVLKNVFNFHRVPIISMKWNHDNTLFLSLDIENVVILWNALTGTVIQHFELMKSNSGNLDGMENANVNSLETLMDANENKISELKKHNEGKPGNNGSNSNVNGVEISWVDTDKFVLPGVSGRLNVYNILSRTPIGKLIGHDRLISDIEFNDSNKLLATCSDDLTIRVWQGTSSNATYCFYGHTQTILSMDWINDDLIITSSLDGSVRIWSLLKQRVVGIKIYDGVPIISSKLSHDKEKYITGLLDGRCVLFDINNFVRSYESNKDQVTMPVPVCGEYSQVNENKDKNDMVFDISWDPKSSEVAISYSNKPGVIISI